MTTEEGDVITEARFYALFWEIEEGATSQTMLL